MPRNLSDEFADELVFGRASADSEWAALAGAIGDLRDRAQHTPVPAAMVDRLATSAAHEARMAATAGSDLVPLRSLPRRLPRFTARLAGAALLFFAIATGAAAGLLPAPMQSLVSSAARVFGVDIPDSRETTSTTKSPDADDPSSGTTLPTATPEVTTTSIPTVVPPVQPPPPQVVLALSSDLSSVPEPGGAVIFSVTLENRSSQRVTITSLTDAIFGDLLGLNHESVRATDCPTGRVEVAGGGEVSCFFEAELQGVGGDANHIGRVTVEVVDGWNRTATASDRVVISFADVLPSVAIAGTTDTTVIDEPVGLVRYQLVISNTSVESVEVVSLIDPVLGDLLETGNQAALQNTCALMPATLATGASFTCSLLATVFGDAVDGNVDLAPTITVIDGQGNLAVGTDHASIAVRDALPSITVTAVSPTNAVTPSYPLAEFSVTLTNTSVEAVTIIGLSDSALGDLLTDTNPVITASSCQLARTQIAAGASISCTFTAALSAPAGTDAFRSTIIATVTDNEGNLVSSSDVTAVAFVPESTRIAGSVFNDLNANGVQDTGEPGIPGVRVVVAVPDFGSVVAVTGSGGHWTALVPVFEVTFLVDATSLPDGSVSTGPTGAEVTPVAGTTTIATSVGYWFPPQRLSGTVGFDVNADGTRNAGEPGVPGVTVRLRDGSGATIASATTDASGGYSFVGNPAGHYTITIAASTVPAGLIPSYESDGSLDMSIGLTPGAHAQVGSLNFGLRGSQAVGGTDGPPNGTASLTWLGFDGLQNTGDELTWSASVGATGHYQFVNLPSGSFRVVFD